VNYNFVADILGLSHSFCRCCLPESRNNGKLRQNWTL